MRTMSSTLTTIDSAFDVKEDTESTESKIQASLDEIDAALESAKKYKD